MINLLPLPAKQNLYYEDLQRKAMFLGELVFVIWLFLVVLMLGEAVFANTRLRNLHTRARSMGVRSEVQQIQQYQQQLRLLKNDLDRLNKIQEKHISVFSVVETLVNTLPSTIQLTDLNVALQEKKILFSGVAPTRGELLILRDALQNNSAYGDVNLPLANLLKETNIPFTFSLSILQK